MSNYNLNISTGTQPTRVRNSRTGEEGSIINGKFIPDPKPESLLSVIAKEIVRTPLRFAATPIAAAHAGLKATMGDLEGANKTLKEGYKIGNYQIKPYRAGKDISIDTDETGKKTVSGGGLGRETVEMLGAGAELASYGMGGYGAKSIVGGGFKGLGKVALRSAGYEALAGAVGGAGVGMQDENATVGSVAKNAAIGAGIGFATGGAFALGGAAVSKVSNKIKGVANKKFGISVPPPPPDGGGGAGAANVVKAVKQAEKGFVKTPEIEKAIMKYDEALGSLNKTKDLDLELRQRAKAMGLNEMSTGEFLLREEIPLNATQENGRLVYSTEDTVETLKTRLTQDIAPVKKQILESKPEANISLNDMRNAAKKDATRGLLEADAIRVEAEIDNLFDAEIAKRGELVTGSDADFIKSALQAKGKYEASTPSIITNAYRKAASAAREILENNYSDVASLRNINYLESQYINAMEILENLGGRVVSGGALSKDLTGIVGTVIGNSSKIPIIGPLVGKEAAEAIRDYMINPGRITSNLIKKIRASGNLKYSEDELLKYLEGIKRYDELQKSANMSTFQRATEFSRSKESADSFFKRMKRH